jgi:hypothetical protein
MAKVKELKQDNTKDPMGPGEVSNDKSANSVKPVFEEIEGMDQNTALSVLIQSAELAQKAGVLSLRDSVILSKAISLFVPGKI